MVCGRMTRSNQPCQQPTDGDCGRHTPSHATPAATRGRRGAPSEADPMRATEVWPPVAMRTAMRQLAAGNPAPSRTLAAELGNSRGQTREAMAIVAALDPSGQPDPRRRRAAAAMIRTALSHPDILTAAGRDIAIATAADAIGGLRTPLARRRIARRVLHQALTDAAPYMIGGVGPDRPATYDPQLIERDPAPTLLMLATLLHGDGRIAVGTDHLAHGFLESIQAADAT